MVIRYTVANLNRRSLGKLINPDLPPGTQPMTTDTPNPSAPNYPVTNQGPPAPTAIAAGPMPTSAGAPAAPIPSPPPAPAAGPSPRWVNEGGNNLTRTLLATGTVAALAVAAIAFLK